MKFYMVYTEWQLGRIEECEVIKETPKTYTIKRDRSGTSVVRKSEMKVWSYLICKTYEEAIQKLKEVLQIKIERCKDTIKKANADMETYNALLADIEK